MFFAVRTIMKRTTRTMNKARALRKGKGAAFFSVEQYENRGAE